MIDTLLQFINTDLRSASLALLDKLGMKYTLGAKTPLAVSDLFKGKGLSKAATEALNVVTAIYFVALIDNRTFNNSRTQITLDSALDEAKEDKYNGMFVFAIDVKPEANLTRTMAATLTRAFNRLAVNKPVVLFIRQSETLSIATCERSNYAQTWREGEKIGKVSVLRGINCKKPHPGHINTLMMLQAPTTCNSFSLLHEHWKEVFSTELLTKKFYTELSDWYAWAIQVIRFPNHLGNEIDNKKYNAENGIRLVTRLIFVWFLKQKKLIPEAFFDQNSLKQIIKDFDPTQKEHSLFGYMSRESKYYKAILQNLFFAMLNCPLTEEGRNEVNVRGFRKYDEDGKATGSNRGDSKLMRYKYYFKDPDAFVEMANSVPFLNGGLFDCLDDPNQSLYFDGFSDNEKVSKALCVPDYLFFGERENIDLSEWYDDQHKGHIKVRGIIDILKSYQFTIEENTPYEQEVSLDPELLGKVFENLLASYNPETNKTARKSTGSYYTPREIVQYMVTESLVAYLKEKVGEDLEPQYRQLLDYSETDVKLNPEQKQQIMRALYQCKVLDPACGSGAFPMGMLQQMVHILSQLDPNNNSWKNLVLEQSGEELAKSLDHDEEERKELQADINRSFDLSQNYPDYARKLYLIENCIYGVDIQTIAIQISKLRCFITLVVDQKVSTNPADNFGIRPLPNLEARFVAANTLIGLGKDLSLANTDNVQCIKDKLAEANHRIFNAKTMRTKRKWREKVKELRKDLSDELIKTGMLSNDDATLIASWDMFDQNTSSNFFDSEWMFGLSNGFDVVIGNPPYIDSETMTATMPKMREKYAKLFKCAKGNWDMFIVFLEKGIDLCAISGTYSFIVPNKLIGADYSETIKEKITTRCIIEIRDYSRVKVFAEVNVYPCTIVGSKKEQSEKIAFTTMQDKINIHSIKVINKLTFSRCPYWDVYFRDEKIVALIVKYLTHPSLKDVKNYIVNTSATVAEAYKIKPVIRDLCQFHDSFKIINTGTIDPYCSLWGIKPMQYIKGRYQHPIISEIDLRQISINRLTQAKSNKIIIAGMSGRIEALYDEGATLAGKSTIIITNSKDGKNSLISLLGILNSKLTSFCLFTMFHSLKMAGGFLNVNKSIISSATMPINAINSEILIKLVKSITSEKQKASEKDTTFLEQQIDILVYLLYGLTYEEIMIVENTEDGGPLSITKATYTTWLERYKDKGVLPSEEEMEHMA